MSGANEPVRPRAKRISVNREFESVQAFINEYVANLSTSGAFIKSKDPLPMGTRVNLRFSVVMEELEIIEGVGQVVRVSEQPRGMGVVFVELTGHSKELLAKLLTMQRMPSGAETRATPRGPR